MIGYSTGVIDSINLPTSSRLEMVLTLCTLVLMNSLFEKRGVFEVISIAKNALKNFFVNYLKFSN